jgi:hypothetical protein
MSPNISLYLCCCFIQNIYKFFYKYFYIHIIWISTKPCITPVEGMNASMNKYA